MNVLIKKLDSIASSIEGKGLLKEAHDLDIISNTIEKLAYNDFEDMVEDFSKEIKNLLPVYQPKDYRQSPQRMTIVDIFTGKGNEDNSLKSDIEKSKKIIGSKLKNLISSAYSSDTGEKYLSNDQEAFKKGLNLTLEFLKDTHNFKEEELKALKDFALSL